MAELYKGWWTQIRTRKMHNMLQAGAGFDEIGEVLGCTGKQVGYRVMNGNSKVSKLMTGDQEAELDQRNRDKRFVAELARAFIRGDHL